MRGHLTEKADVFGFGVVALEIVSGRTNSDESLEEDKIYLLEWVKSFPFLLFSKALEQCAFIAAPSGWLCNF